MVVPAPARFLGRVGAWFGHAGAFVVVSLLAGALLAGLAIPFAAGVGIAARNSAESFQDVEVDQLTIGALPGRTTMYAANGERMATFYEQNRQEVTLDQVSVTMQQALLAIEDRRFYEHGPVDLRGVMRALLSNLQEGEVTEGASTLTMQYARNLLVLNAETEQEQLEAIETTPERKIAEIKYAIALEEQYSKDDILEGYLNTVFFGNRSYGIEIASRNYFNVSAKDLTLAQSAMLAGLVRDPVGTDPTRNLAIATQRRNTVLDSMVVAGFITPEQSEVAKAEAVALSQPQAANGCITSTAPLYCDYAYRWLLTRSELGETEEARRDLLQNGGISIITTMQPSSQAAAQQSISSRVEPTNPVAAAQAVIEPGTGAVFAIASSRGFGNDEGQTTVNYAVDFQYGQNSGFQAGSTFKIFTLAAAMEQGVSLFDRYPGRPTTFTGFTQCEDGSPYPGIEENWPKNSTSSSANPTVLEATAQSVNTAFVGIEEQITQCSAVEMANRLGAHRADGAPFNQTPSFTLGPEEVSPLSMASSIATIAAGGVRCEPMPVHQVKDRDGNVLLQNEPQCEQVLDPRWAAATSYALQGVIEDGTGRGHGLDRAAAGKTGTTDSNIAVWFVGYTPNLAAAVWVGNPDSSTYPLENITIGGQYYPVVYGGTLPAPIWHDTMQATLDGMQIPVVEFPEPPEESMEGRPVFVPDVRGMTVEAATERLEAADFRVVVSPTPEFSDYPKGTVARTDPTGGSGVNKGSTITIHVSGGPQGPGGGGGGGNENCPPRALICPPQPD